VLHFSERENKMSYLVDRKTELHFRTAATVVASGKARVIVVESRAKYAVVKLAGSRERYPISWEQIFYLAEKRHGDNLRLERDAAKQLARQSKQRAPRNVREQG
jgi:hypothetical protein